MSRGAEKRAVAARRMSHAATAAYSGDGRGCPDAAGSLAAHPSFCKHHPGVLSVCFSCRSHRFFVGVETLPETPAKESRAPQASILACDVTIATTARSLRPECAAPWQRPARSALSSPPPQRRAGSCREPTDTSAIERSGPRSTLPCRHLLPPLPQQQRTVKISRQQAMSSASAEAAASVASSDAVQPLPGVPENGAADGGAAMEEGSQTTFGGSFQLEAPGPFDLAPQLTHAPSERRAAAASAACARVPTAAHASP